MAATPINWNGSPGADFSANLTLSAGWSGTVSVRAYYSEGGLPVPAVLQPSVNLVGTDLAVTFEARKTKALPNSTFVEVKTGTDSRFAGPLFIDHSAPGTVTPSLPITSVQGLSAQLSTINNKLGQLQADKLDVKFTTTDQQLDAQATGNDPKLIWKRGYNSRLVRYEPQAQEPKEDVFTSKI